MSENHRTNCEEDYPYKILVDAVDRLMVALSLSHPEIADVLNCILTGTYWNEAMLPKAEKKQMKGRKLYKVVATTLGTIARCRRSMEVAIDPDEKISMGKMVKRYTDQLEQIARDLLPSGSGVNDGTQIDICEMSTYPKFTLTFKFQHMDEHGGYDGWTEHYAKVRPTWDGIDLYIGGQNRDNCKEYLSELYNHALTQEISWEEKANLWVSTDVLDFQPMCVHCGKVLGKEQVMLCGPKCVLGYLDGHAASGHVHGNAGSETEQVTAPLEDGTFSQ